MILKDYLAAISPKFLKLICKIHAWWENVLREPGGGHGDDDVALDASPVSLGRAGVGQANQTQLG